jgi:regulatory protein
MRIVRVTQSKHVPERYYLTLEDGNSLKVGLNQIADYAVYEGRELTEEELASLKDDARETNTRARALRILGERNMSKKQMTERLIQKGEDPELSQETAQWLEEIGAIDDGVYAGLIVRHYAARGFGAGRIKNELYRRGIPREYWEDALTELPDMEDAAYEFIRSRMRGAEPDARS